jgi:hypothetical protein
MVNFSGTLTDVNGKPLTGTSGVTFYLYKDSQGGSPLWLETQNVQADTAGHYKVMLGATTSHGLPSELFVSGEARWLGVQIQGQAEQPRVLLLSVPYALKAADAQTIGGLPPSAFVLALPASNTATTGGDSGAGSNAGTTAGVTGSGTTDFLPLWTSGSILGNSVLFQSGSGASAKVGINITAPLATLDVNGTTLLRGLSEMATTGLATASQGFNSSPFNFESSAYNSSTKASTLEHFQWQSEPAGNNTSTPSATLNLLFGIDPAAPAETGLKLSSKGLFTFATGQTFPGAGTVTSVGSGAGLAGGPITTSGTLSIATGGVTNAMLANSSLTVTANSPLSGGGAVSLGGSTSLGLTSCGANQILQFISGAWKCANAGSGTVTSVGSGAGLTGGPITTSGSLSIATGGVTNAMLAHSSVTVAAGTGMSGGGAVSLGNSVTLNNSGVLSVTTGSGITDTGGQNPTLGIDTTVVPELALENFFTANQIVIGFLESVVGDSTALYAFNASTVPTNPALYVEDDDLTFAGDLALDVQGPNFGGECSVDVSGNLFCTGVLGASVNGQDNKKIGLYTMQSSEDWIEDFGSGTLSRGVATIQLESRFARTISGQTDYHVFLTPSGDCEGLYIANRTANSFEVRELKRGISSVPFDYRIVAHRKGFESARLPDVTAKLMGKRVRPTLPAHNAKLISRRQDPSESK